MLLRLVRDFRRAMDLSLVLTEEGVPHELRSVGEEEWAIVVTDADSPKAEAAVAAFERENPPPASAPPVESAGGIAAATGTIFFLSLLALHIWTGPESGNVWFARGAADAAAILRGEWWRAITALTLHADAAHAVGNAALGGLLLALLARRLGAGTACALLLLAGSVGTLGAAALLRRNFVSIGASTAVFGALGSLAALEAADPAARRRAWIPLGAGLALLAFLGTGKRADLAGHLCGFLAGTALGALAARAPRLRSRFLQLSVCAACIAGVALAWLRALRA